MNKLEVYLIVVAEAKFQFNITFCLCENCSDGKG